MDTHLSSASQAKSVTLSLVPPSVPVMDRERFAVLVGIDLGVVNGWIDRGYVPTVKIGRHRLINLAVLTVEALSAGTGR